MRKPAPFNSFPLEKGPCFLILVLILSSSMRAMQTDNTITLSDGRTLAYAEYGDPKGFPILYFHGGQESRHSSAFMDSVAFELKVKIIAPDRPGVGLSSYKDSRSFLDWAKDIEELTTALGLNAYSIFGLSGGGPHVLACAYKNPEKLYKVAVVSGTAPHHYKRRLRGIWFPVKLVHWFAAAKNDKNLRKFMEREHKALSEKPEKRLRQLQKYLPKPDRRLLLAKPEYGEEFIKGSLESFSQGIEAAVQEWKLYVSDWGFVLKDIQKPVGLWYGDKDKMTPKYRGIYLQKQLPNASLKILEDEGHFSLIR